MTRWYPILLFLAVASSTNPLALARVNKSKVLNNGRRCNRWFIDGDPTKLVCVCSEDLCDQIDFEWPQQRDQMTLIQSSRLGRRFEVKNLADAAGPPGELSGARIHVRLDRERQSIIGWGGSFSDATGINLNSLPYKTAELLIASYFGKQGLQYNMGRVPIGGTDFSTRPYTYDDSAEDDLELSKWALADEDLNLKIPHIKRAMELVQERGEELKLFATPWSAPAWMKTSKSLVCGHLIDSDEIYASYTNYLMRFYDAYEQYGIQFWGATVQNEPIIFLVVACVPNSMAFNNLEMSKFIGKHLGPAMRARGWTKDNFKLMIGDDSIAFIDYQWPSMLGDDRVSEYISGLAFHWYHSGVHFPYHFLDLVHEKTVGMIEFLLMTEACTGWLPGDNSQILGNWTRAEMYAVDIIEDLNHHAAGWVDWNLALDLGGGPNWIENIADSPIKVDAEKGEFYKQPTYYALAHFSRLFPPGSVVLETKVADSSEGVMAVAALIKPSGHLALTVLNKSGEPKTVHVQLEGAKDVSLKPQAEPFLVEANSINSLVIKL